MRALADVQLRWREQHLTRHDRLQRAVGRTACARALAVERRARKKPRERRRRAHLVRKGHECAVCRQLHRTPIVQRESHALVSVAVSWHLNRAQHGRALGVARVQTHRQLGEARGAAARALVRLHLKRKALMHATRQREDTYALVAVVLVGECQVMWVTKATARPRRRRRRPARARLELGRAAALVAWAAGRHAHLAEAAGRRSWRRWASGRRRRRRRREGRWRRLRWLWRRWRR